MRPQVVLGLPHVAQVRPQVVQERPHVVQVRPQVVFSVRPQVVQVRHPQTSGTTLKPQAPLVEKGRLPRLQPFFAQDWGNCLISLLLPCLGWPGRRPLKLVTTQNGLCRQMNGLCLTHTSYSTSRPRQMKLRWPDPPSFLWPLPSVAWPPPQPPPFCLT